MEYVLNDVEPLYMFLRFADTDKTPNLSEVTMEYQNMRQTYASKFSSDYPRFEKIMAVIDARMNTVMSGTYMATACALNPYVQYSLGTSQTVMAVLLGEWPLTKKLHHLLGGLHLGEIHQCCKGSPDACWRSVQPLVDVKGTGAPLLTSTPNCAVV